MFCALDLFGNKVSADDAEIGTEYFCPVCHESLYLKRGKINLPHFAHKCNGCTDSWHYDMSDWHKTMQSYFPIETQEVVVKIGEKVHRADVLVDKTVFEMQHSPISFEEFNERTHFFLDNGYRLVWIFDYREKFNNNNIEYLNNADEYKFKWLNPVKIFTLLKGNAAINDYNKNFSLCFQLYDEQFDIGCVSKIVWTINQGGFADLSRFCIAKDDIYLSENLDIEDFFISQKRRTDNAIKSQIHELKALCKRDNFRYFVKYSGIKGLNREQYICPRKNTMVNVYKGNGCEYCRYCYLLVSKKNNVNKKEFAIYCTYPHQVNKLDGFDSEYECSNINRIDY